jgi:hypothetical protein
MVSIIGLDQFPVLFAISDHAARRLVRPLWSRAEQTPAAIVWLLDRELVMRNDPRDRFIRALAAQLGAERETRAAIAYVFANGEIDREALLALLEVPIPAWSQEDLNRADRLATSAAQQRAIAA